MLYDLTFFNPQPPSPSCPHMDTCSLLLYLDGCASCTFTARQFGRGEPVGLAASAPFLPGNHARGKRKLRSPRRNG